MGSVQLPTKQPPNAASKKSWARKPLLNCGLRDIVENLTNCRLTHLSIAIEFTPVQG
jgi:hypothetical protein